MDMPLVRSLLRWRAVDASVMDILSYTHRREQFRCNHRIVISAFVYCGAVLDDVLFF